jgi:hypothetical protein
VSARRPGTPRRSAGPLPQPAVQGDRRGGGFGSDARPRVRVVPDKSRGVNAHTVRRDAPGARAGIERRRASSAPEQQVEGAPRSARSKDAPPRGNGGQGQRHADGRPHGRPRGEGSRRHPSDRNAPKWSFRRGENERQLCCVGQQCKPVGGSSACGDCGSCDRPAGRPAIVEKGPQLHGGHGPPCCEELASSALGERQSRDVRSGSRLAPSAVFRLSLPQVWRCPAFRTRPQVGSCRSDPTDPN